MLAHTTFTSAIHERIKGKTYDDHLKAITHYRDAVKDLSSDTLSAASR